MRLGLVLVGGALLVGCGASHDAAKTAVSPLRTVRHEAPAPDTVLRDVQVTVVDGDTNARVRGARVSIGHRAARSNSHGVARIPLLRRAALVTQAVKPGYDKRAVRLSFRTRPKSTIRIYRRSLQWAMYGAVPSRTQAQAAIRVRPPFRVVWSRGLDGLIEFPAVVSDGVAYIGNAKGTIFALSMDDGTLLWEHDTRNGKMASSPAVWGDDLVVHGMDGHVWVLRRSDGRLLWHYTVGSPVESSPVVIDDVDIFGAWNGTITALDLKTHRVRWSVHTGCKITSSAAVEAGTFYIGDYCARLFAMRVRDGHELWSRPVNGRIYGTPAVAAGRVFVPSSTGDSLTAFSTGGRFLWRRTTGGYVYSSPAVLAGHVFVGSYSGVFYAFSTRTGATSWSHQTGGPISGAVSVVDGVAYAGSFSHHIFGIDARSGRIVLDFPHGEYAPVSGSGKRLLLHAYSRLYAVEHD